MLQPLGEIIFIFIGISYIHRRIDSARLTGTLYIATDGDYCRVRIILLCAVDHLSGFSVRDIGHGARIYHINIRLILKLNDIMPLLLQGSYHLFGLIVVHLAAQGEKCYLHIYHQLFLNSP